MNKSQSDTVRSVVIYLMRALFQVLFLVVITFHFVPSQSRATNCIQHNRRATDMSVGLSLYVCVCMPWVYACLCVRLYIYVYDVCC